MNSPGDAISPEPNTDLQAVLQQAAEYSDEGNWDEAFATLTEVEEEHANDPMLLCMLAVAAEETLAEGLSYEYLKRCAEQQPQDPHVLMTIGTMLARYDDPDAETALRLAAISAPTVPGTRLFYGAYLAREGMLDLALEELQAALEVDPTDARVYREIGIARLLRDEDAEAVAALESAAGHAEDDAEIRLLYALALLRVDEAELAAEELHRASTELVAEADIQLLSALASAEQGWDDEAWNALARAEAAEIAPSSTTLYEVEEALEAGEDDARRLLREHLAPSVLRERLLAPPG